MFPGLEPKLQEVEYDNAVFVSKSNFEKYMNLYNLNIKNYIVTGNCITDDKIIDRNKIKSITKKKKYKGIVLTRLSTDRTEDIKNIINFGKELSSRNINNIIVDVYGTGNAVDYLENLIEKNNLSKYIKYKGLTTNTLKELRKHDYLLDFSINQSFGMIYLEGILAGKKIYANYNDGSKEVLSGFKNTIYHDFDELINMLNKFEKVTQKDLLDAYDKIMKKYSKEVITKKFISIIK